MRIHSPLQNHMHIENPLAQTHTPIPRHTSYTITLTGTLIFLWGLSGYIAAAQAADNSVTNFHRPKSVQEARERGNITRLRQFEVRKREVDEVRKQKVDPNTVALISSFGVKEQSSGPYFAIFLSSVKNHWIRLLEQVDDFPKKIETVVLEFKLKSDGSVSDMKTLESTGDERWRLLCQSAIRNPAPFARWPGEMQQGLGAESRTITLTFNYLPDGVKSQR